MNFDGIECCIAGYYTIFSSIYKYQLVVENIPWRQIVKKIVLALGVPTKSKTITPPKYDLNLDGGFEQEKNAIR